MTCPVVMVWANDLSTMDRSKKILNLTLKLFSMSEKREVDSLGFRLFRSKLESERVSACY